MGRLKSPVHYLIIGLRGFFGGHSLLSGLNYFVEFVPTPKVTHPLAGPFIDSMTAMGFFDVVKVTETAVGICLLTGLFVPLALVLEMPISVSIFFTSVIVVHSDRSVITGSREILVNLVLLAAYAGYYLPMLRMRAVSRPIWRSRWTTIRQSIWPERTSQVEGDSR